MQRFRHIGIAGAGLLGRLLAWRLSRFGIRVELFDSDTVDGTRSCAHIAGGMLAPFSELIDCDGDVAKLGLDSLALWTSWADELEMGVFQEQFGSLMVVHNRDRSELHHFYRRVSDKIARSNFPNSIEYLDSQKILEMEPDLPEYFSEAVYMPLEGHIDSRQLMLALKNELERLDVLWHSDVKIDIVADSRLIGE
ncbi:MAG: FAD-dependent oxidoreductase, partial [Leptolyngbya sp.]|nr:FAD-dependent oxidoreductase [Candidatus Melainabacteria bacterium]